MCLLDVREGGCADEEGKGSRWRSKQKTPRWGLVELSDYVVSVLVWIFRYAVSDVYLGFVFCNSCAFLWELEMRKEGLAVQCLFSIRLLSLGQQLLSQLLPESPWQHLPLWAGRKTMPNIRKKQNHCLHMSRDCPPLVCLLWSMIANLCKTIPVAKEEGALERNILVRTQNKRQALLGHAFYSYSPHKVTHWFYKSKWWPVDQNHHSIYGPSLQLSNCCLRLRQPFWRSWWTITINKSQPKFVIVLANYWRAFTLGYT